MAEQEGVIKYRLDYHWTDPLEAALIRSLNAWRELLRELGLIGQDPARYGGLGFGNLSRRLENPQGSGASAFLISGTQTSHLARLGPEHYARVRECDAKRNWILADGPIHPSSEALTHGAIYAAAPELGYVFHTHCPAIWQHARALGIELTGADVPYGTPEMAAAVQRLFATTNVRRRGAFAMGGHEDGVISFGANVEAAGCAMVSLLAQALELTDQH
jgi:ribulose-5-phosphate 4-epimerase/fuculose-1-phosphate aldolase